MNMIRRILVIGAGTMGHGFAEIFAMNGLSVVLVDETDEALSRAKKCITENLACMVEFGELRREDVESTSARIERTTDLKKGVSKVHFVLEAVSENLALKKKIFKQLGRWAEPGVILATNTSSFDINEFSAVTAYPERVIGTHWFHPPQITPCVEVIPSKITSKKTITTVINFLRRIGKAPAICKSAPGFIANRIQLAMAAEAFAIVGEGLATPADVDRIVKTSFGFRLGAYGPCEICDQAGADTYQAIYEYLYSKLGRDQFRPPKVLQKLTQEGRFGLKTQKGFYDYKQGVAEVMKKERDRKLYARLRLFREEQKARHLKWSQKELIPQEKTNKCKH